MFEEFKNKCNFMCVYINEAHAVDEWPVRTNSQLCIKQHQTLSDRCIVAKQLIQDYNLEISVFVDTMENHFQNIYAAWPLRAFIIQKQKNSIHFTTQTSWLL